jgi:hypothetical protein
MAPVQSHSIREAARRIRSRLTAGYGSATAVIKFKKQEQAPLSVSGVALYVKSPRLGGSRVVQIPTFHKFHEVICGSTHDR